MKYLVIIFFSLIISKTHSQLFKLHNNAISIQVKLEEVNDTIFKYDIYVENKNSKNIYIFNEKGKQYLTNYIGIGIYSIMYPYLPIHTKKIEMVQICSNFKETFKGEFIWIDKGSISITLDYYIGKKKKYKSKKKTISIKMYNRRVRNLKIELNVNKYKHK